MEGLVFLCSEFEETRWIWSHNAGPSDGARFYISMIELNWLTAYITVLNPSLP